MARSLRHRRRRCLLSGGTDPPPAGGRHGLRGAGAKLPADGAFRRVLLQNPFTEEPYGIGIPKDDDEFRTFINDRLEEIYESGEWAEAFESTVGAVAEETPEPPPGDRY